MTPRDVRGVERDRGALRVIAVLVTVFVAGMAIRGLFMGESRSTRSLAVSSGGAGASRRAGPGPTAVRDGIPMGFARTSEGARAAAVAYVVTGQVMLDLAPTQVDDAVRGFAASGSADAQVADLQRQLAKLRDKLADGIGPVRYLQAPLAVRVDAFTRERARVLVWSVGVLSRRNAAPPQAGWTTSTFDLVWERGDWKVWAESVASGPTPELNAGALPATDEQFDAALDGFTPWGMP